MKFTGIIVSVYGIVVVLGGLVGYLTADSLPSLIAGSVCGALLFASGLGLIRSSVIAFFTGLGVTLALAVFFGARYYLTLKMMPAGMMTVISLTILLLLLTTKGQPKRKVER